MNVRKHFFAAVVLLAAPCLALATPVDLGSAGTYTLLSIGANPNSVILGSNAEIHGNVGARYFLNMASGAEILGNADYGIASIGAGASITGASTTRGNSFWNDVASDLQTASNAAKAMTGTNEGAITASTIFASSGHLSVFKVSKVNLGAGESLTLKGDADDQFVVNVGGNFALGGGAIKLDGVSADNVLFNIYGNGADVNVGAGHMQGTYIAPKGTMELGDGLTLKGVRFLGKTIQGNLQDVYEPTPVPEPSGLPMMVIGLLGIAGLEIYRRSR